MFEMPADDNHVHALARVIAAGFLRIRLNQSSERGSGGRQSAKATVQAHSIQTPVMSNSH